MAVDSYNQNSIEGSKSSERNLMDDATFELIRQKTIKRPKSCRVALQILKQETKNDKCQIFMRWENPNAHPNAQKSWSWADDITEDLKRTIYKTHSPDGGPQIMSMDYTNKPTFKIQSRNGKYCPINSH